ncbi:MAG TPA: MiaB/RimO family radical SAM methylthiotransferase, partial [Terriglobales bacterium]
TSFVPLATLGAAEILVGDIFAHTQLIAAPVFEADTASEKTRPNLKVQDGCNNRCSFCIIPFVRGKSRSLALNEVIREAQGLVELGYKEVVLSGINLGRWGRDFGGRTRFVDLLRAMLSETDIRKIRISSVEPMDWSDELIELAATSPRICKHAHVPLQSGSDRILRRMHRKYRPWHYADRIQKIRAAMPTAAIGADVMVGFPGETDAQFEETRSFIESLPFTYLHVFTYSSRPGTPSAVMPDQVHGNVTRERNRILRDLAASKKRAFQEQFVGGTLEAITLTNIENGRTEGLTDNYQKVWIAGRHEANQLVEVAVDGIENDAILGRLHS